MTRLPAMLLVGLGLLPLAGSTGSAPPTPAPPAPPGVPAAGGVRVMDTSGPRPVPCKEVEADHEPYIEGGCSAHLNAFKTSLTIRTLFGPLRFADCISDFDMTIAADGRLWLDNLRFGGTSPCNDVWPCAPPEVIALRRDVTEGPIRDKVPPWRGDLLEADGRGFTGRFGLCVDTCVGRYEGDVAIRLARGEHGWQLRARSAGVGSSGLEIDAAWDLLDPVELAVERAPRR